MKFSRTYKTLKPHLMTDADLFNMRKESIGATYLYNICNEQYIRGLTRDPISGSGYPETIAKSSSEYPAGQRSPRIKNVGLWGKKIRATKNSIFHKTPKAVIKEVSSSLEQAINLRAKKIFEQIPEIKKSFCFSYRYNESGPFKFDANLSQYLFIDEISVYPKNEEQEKECNKLAKYFPFGDDVPKKLDKVLLIKDLIQKMFDDDFIKMLGCYIILSEKGFSGNLTFYKDGREFET